MTARPAGRRRAEHGSITPLIIGFALVVAMLVAVVVDASAAFLRRQGLNSAADAAALAATDGLQGQQVYLHGLHDRAEIDPVAARRFVAGYLVDSGLRGRYPGLRYTVSTTRTGVVVRLSAPMELPLHLAGLGSDTLVTGTAASVVVISE